MPYRTPYGIEDEAIVRAMRDRSRLQLSTRCRVFCGTCNDTSTSTCPDCPDTMTTQPELLTGLTYNECDGRVAVSNSQRLLGYVERDGSFCDSLAGWCDGFPDDACTAFRTGIAGDAITLRGPDHIGTLVSRPGIVTKRRDTQGARDRLDRVDISIECVVHADTSLELPLEIPEPSNAGEWTAKLHPAYYESGTRGMWLTARWYPGRGYTAEGECETFVSSCEEAEKLLRAW